MSKVKYLGSHVSLAAPEFYLGTVKEALSYGADTFMFYTGAPQNTRRAPLDTLKIEEGRQLILEAGIDESKIVVHAPYIMNMGNTIKPGLYEGSVEFLQQEMERTAGFGAKLLVLHPGAHVGAGAEAAIEQIARGLNEVLENDTTGTIICLETMAGKGTEVGRSFEEIAAIIEKVDKKEQLGVCFDTCHTNDAGYDIHDVDGLLAHFDEVIGLEYFKILHINDSKNERGASKDRHDNLGYGTIGFETIKKWVHHPLLKDVAKILETPWIEKTIAPYKHEIAMLRSGEYVENWREPLEEQAKQLAK
ncbi:MAG: deoxyribonuclease IV [Erysipelotrichaceae bacterium]|nr:deoxyribonuclease IV [Erysipelotrichaceae bacterium]